MVLATPLSSAMICCVRTAIVTDCSVGRASVSSRELVWRLWVPPMTAASAWIVVRMTLFTGCWAVSEHPAVWVWKRSIQERGSFASKRSFMTRAQMRRAARYLATSSKKSLWALKKNERRGANSSGSIPASMPAWT